MASYNRPSNPYAGPRTGNRPGAGSRVSERQLYRRPTAVTVIAVLNWIAAPFLLLVAFATSQLGRSEPGVPQAFFLALAAFYLVCGFLSVVCGIGLWNLKAYGRTIQLVFSFLGLLAIPLGTVISIIILVYLFKPGVKLLFEQRPVARLSEWEVDEVMKLQQSSGAVIVLAIVVPLMIVAFIGMVAAIAIPSLLRARVSANESAAIGDMRTLIASEAAYASSNGGFYDRLECLAKPTECIPGYPAAAPVFLNEVLPAVHFGYQREFHPGPPAGPAAAASRKASPSSVRSFAYVAHPVTPGTTGIRGFCGDDTGFICFTRDGAAPAVVDGRCDPKCTPLQ